MLISASYTIKVLKNTGTICTKRTAKNKCIPIFFFSFTLSCNLGLINKTKTKNTSDVIKYVKKLFVPNFIKVPIKERTYIIPTACPLLSAAAIKLSPNGTIEKITFSELNPTIEIKKLIVYKIMFCFANSLCKISFTLSFCSCLIS